ncbi:hypothetical protein A2223_02565 [Candidatus Falkowbacteria bacterium RIFOXYA2_FULL_35_8]|nr:MAG: hypothetical protein A2223_02565 [Candidatus Falkowbacteria bacterium RIFOXYA2_FULL_35_8]
METDCIRIVLTSSDCSVKFKVIQSRRRREAKMFRGIVVSFFELLDVLVFNYVLSCSDDYNTIQIIDVVNFVRYLDECDVTEISFQCGEVMHVNGDHSKRIIAGNAYDIKITRVMCGYGLKKCRLIKKK